MWVVMMRHVMAQVGAKFEVVSEHCGSWIYTYHGAYSHMQLDGTHMPVVIAASVTKWMFVYCHVLHTASSSTLNLWFTGQSQALPPPSPRSNQDQDQDRVQISDLGTSAFEIVGSGVWIAWPDPPLLAHRLVVLAYGFLLLVLSTVYGANTAAYLTTASLNAKVRWGGVR